LHIVLEASALLLLVLAADTGFADFPRLLSMLASDGILPHAFAVRGARLAFSNGIMLVAAISAMLIIAFHGSVSALVPLFTVGAFGTFTLSQAGMARHWWHKRGNGWHWRMAINGIGAVVTSVVLVVVIVSKFAYGAWIVVLLLPLLVLLLHVLGAHHDQVTRQLRVASAAGAQRVLSRVFCERLVIMVGGIDRAVLHAVAYARALDTDVEAVHITDDLSRGKQLLERWDNMQIGVRLVLLYSPVRSTAHALMRYLDLIQREAESPCLVTVVLPEVQPTRWWHPLVHNYFAWRLKWTLLFRENVVVTSVPYEIRD
jgi:hypothetical protein